MAGIRFIMCVFLRVIVEKNPTTVSGGLCSHAALLESHVRAVILAFFEGCVPAASHGIVLVLF